MLETAEQGYDAKIGIVETHLIGTTMVCMG